MLKLMPRGARIAAGLGLVAVGVGMACLLSPTHASAQSRLSSSLTVPPEGLFFRTPDGRILARLYSGTQGGVFELYDAQGHPRGGGLPPPLVSQSGWAPGELSEGLADPWGPSFSDVARRPPSGL
jgi:hypothetical protein